MATRTTILATMLALSSFAAGPAALGAPTAKLPPAVSKEMTEVIVAMDKALGLESWPTRGEKPCVDRGGQGITAKDVGVEETRKCAASAIEKGYPELGKSYALAILMAAIGPVTVVTLGTGELTGWAAYSCDPGRKCLPTKLDPGNKWGKRMIERQTKACTDPTTIWFPSGARACAGVAAAPAAATPATKTTTTTQPPPAAAPAPTPAPAPPKKP